MAELREMPISVVDWEARFILQSIGNELLRLKALAESGDEDESIDAANDYVALSGLYERLSENAASIFGKQITNFSDQYL